jgi:hypothetical protein
MKNSTPKQIFIRPNHAVFFSSNRRRRHFSIVRILCLAAVALLTTPSLVLANLFVVDTGTMTPRTGTIGEYTNSGVPINASLISGLNEPRYIAVSGGFIYVSTADGTIGKYTTSGATVNPSLITGLNGPLDLVVSGNHLFVGNNFGGTVGEYTTSGATVNASLISGLDRPTGLALSGTKLFVSGTLGVGEYTTSGAVINPHLIPDLGGALHGTDITLSGSNLLVEYYNGDGLFVGKYGTDGSVVNSELLTLFNQTDQGIAASGTDLFVVEDNAVVEYTTSGTLVSNPLIGGLTNGIPIGITVSGGASVPETLSSFWLALTAAALLGVAHCTLVRPTG